jgi:Uma2 family endonuclease
MAASPCVVSPSPRDQRRDRSEKVEEYARFGIRIYWLIDPQLRSLEICERQPGGTYARRGRDAVRSRSFPAVRVSGWIWMPCGRNSARSGTDDPAGELTQV